MIDANFWRNPLPLQTDVRRKLGAGRGFAGL
jgi:hypothetical protein